MKALQLSQLTTADQVLLTGLNAAQDSICRWAEKKGFWNIPLEIQEAIANNPEQVGTFIERLIKSQKLLLQVSELAECMEGLRKPMPVEGDDYTNEEEELADAVIRILDYAGKYKLRLAEAIIAKMAVNAGRPYMHGKTF